MEITLTVNGKQVNATVDDQEMKEAMGGKEQKKTGYEKTPTAYFYHSPDGVVRIARVTNNSSSIESASNNYNSGNFYSRHEVARNNARADNLMRKLRRFAAEMHGCLGICKSEVKLE